MQEIKEQLEKELGKIQQVIDTSSLTDLRQRVQTAITDAKSNVNAHLDKFEAGNAVADQFVDPYLEKTVRSKWTALITGAVVLGSFILGLIVGTNI
ncbi:hypothetical protein [Nitrosomonas sp.]|uniref:hypothetical protein n=1 Tax=Nitrosomonas sp. TaxID=42353 RepID=UPI0025F6C607|nr:hypothetical protein [Nitrosomonas sp.]MBV6447305.1 hypothetical protein [Nitrosomonas sp.]